MQEGRPTLFKKEYCQLATNYCLLGATDPQLAVYFDVAESTIHNWKNDHPEFLEAIKAGKEDADANVAKSLYQRALGYSHKDTDIRVLDGKIAKTPITKHYPPDTKAAVFWLNNRQKKLWRESKEITGADGEPLIPKPDSDMETVRKLAFLLTKTATESDESK